MKKFRFLQDCRFNEMHYGAIIRSPISQGQVTSIKLPTETPEDFTFFRPSDITGKKDFTFFNDSFPLLGGNKISYEGEPLLLVSCPSHEELQTVIKKVTLSYEQSPPASPIESYDPSQVYRKKNITFGKTAGHFKGAFQIVEGTYTTPFQGQISPDPDGACALVHDGILYVYVASAWPTHVKKSVADALGRKEDTIEIMPLHYPPAYNSKIWAPSLFAIFASQLSVKCGKPVLLVDVYDRYVQKKHKPNSAAISIRSALNENGAPLACRMTIDIDCGAHPLFTDEIIGRVAVPAVTQYGYRDFDIQLNLLTSNTAPAIPSPGFGAASILFALEVHAARLAELSLSSPSDWKRKFSGISSRKVTIETCDNERMLKLIETITDESDFQRKYSAYEMVKKAGEKVYDHSTPLRGIGISSGAGANGLLQSTEAELNPSVLVRLDADSHVTIETTAAGSISRTEEIWKKITAHELEVESDDIEISWGTGSETTEGGPSIASRTLSISTMLLSKCCDMIKKKRFRDPLPIQVRRTFRMLKTPSWDPESFSGKPFISHSLGAAVVELEIDRVTLEPEIRNVWLYADCGSILDREAAIQTLETGIYHSLSWTTLEKVWLRKKIKTIHGTGIRDGYALPGVHIKLISGKKKLPPEGIDFLPFLVIPAAYINAVSQATGVYFDTLPLNSEQIRTALEPEDV